MHGIGGVIPTMKLPSSPYDICNAKFEAYPLAVDDCDADPKDDCNDDLQSMVLMQHKGNHPRFFVLSHEYGGDRAFFLLRCWRTGRATLIEADNANSIPEDVTRVVADGVPIPRHGSVFGWNAGDIVAALIVLDTDYSAASPEPRWSVMPLVGTGEAAWPPFITQSLLGNWFWEHYTAKRIVFLGDLIADNPGTVFWVDTGTILGWDSCAVAHDIKSPAGFTLLQGGYVYWRVLRKKKPVPPLDKLLARKGKTDVASQFQRCKYGENL